MGSKRAVILLCAATLGGVGCSSETTSPTPSSGGVVQSGTGGTTPVTGGTTPVTGGTTPVTGGTTPVTGGAALPSGGIVEQTECPGGDRVDPVGECAANAPGVYAMKTVLDVFWNPKPDGPGLGHSTLVNPGRGKIDIYMLGELYDVCQKPDGNGDGMGRVRSCGTRIPAFSSEATCGIMDITIPDSAWNTVQPFDVDGSTTGFDVGDTLNLGPTSATVGITMDDPDNGEFPTPENLGTYTCDGGAKSGFDCFPDEDNDGFPGITAQIRNDDVQASEYPSQCGTLGHSNPYFYRPAPASADPTALGGGNIAMNPGNYIKTVRLGLRIKLGGGGVIDAGCMSGQGPVQAAGLEVIVIDCVLQNDMPCTAEQADFLAKRTPTYEILNAGDEPNFLPLNPVDRNWWGPWTYADTAASEGPKGAVVRLGDLNSGVTCDQVRAADFPF